MANHARKRQKTKKTPHVRPLGTAAALTDDASKDDEERQLESLLFGKPFVPASGKQENTDRRDEDDDDDEGGPLGVDQELQNLTDADVSNFLTVLSRARFQKTFDSCPAFLRGRWSIGCQTHASIGTWI